MASWLLGPRPRHQGLPGIREASGPVALSSEDTLPIGGLGWICRGGEEELLWHPRSVPPQMSSTLLCDKKDTYPVAAAGRWYV